jgi:hypothetical protein
MQPSSLRAWLHDLRWNATCWAGVEALRIKELEMGHSSQMPPVPPAAQTRKGPGGSATAPRDTSKKKEPPANTEEQGRQGNINQNTHHQGYQQDR